MRRVVGGILALVMVFSLPAYAAESDRTAQRREDLEFLYTTLKENHPNLFANTDEKVFLAKKAEIEKNLSGMDDFTFGLELKALMALAGDGHTTMGLDMSGCHLYPVGLQYLDGWVCSTLPAEHRAYLGWSVAGVNGLTMEQVTEKMALYLSSDNEMRLRRQVGQAFGVAELFVRAGITEPDGPLLLDLLGANGETVRLSLSALPGNDQSGWPELARLQPSASPSTAAQNRYYFSQDLGDAYYIQYNTCREDPELPMEEFAAEVARDLESGQFQKVMIDLRNNGGGSDGVLVPVLMLLAPMVRSGQLDVYGLIGEGTFSSAAINAMEIREMGGFLVGEPSGGSVDHFGAVNTFQLPNSGMRGQYSTKYITLADYMECAVGLGVTAIQPEVAAPQTLKDYLAGRDTAVETVLRLKHPPAVQEEGETPLSRGRFTALLRQAVGAETVGYETPFGDVFPFNWYTPDIAWAAEAGIVSGVTEGKFAPAGTVTWQEAAVMVERCLAYMGKTLPVVREENCPAESSLWAAGAVERAWQQGLLPESVEPHSPMTRQDGQWLTDRLTEIL